MGDGTYRYDRALGASEVLVRLIDRRKQYSSLADEIQQAALRYGFTFKQGVAVSPREEDAGFSVRHLIICDGTDDPEAATEAYRELLDHATSATLAMHYTSQAAFDSATPAVERLKTLHRHKINYLRPTPASSGFLPTKQKLVDNAICDSVRIKYRPRRLGQLGEVAVSQDVLQFFRQASRLVEIEQLFHRASTDGFISMRSPDGNGFFITCTKTDKVGLDLERIALVESYDRSTNELAYWGNYLPSSDSVEAAALYERLPNIGAILHTHASTRFTRNPQFRSKIAVPPSSYGEADLGDRIAEFVLARPFQDFIIMEDHGEMFFGWDRTPEDCLRTIAASVGSRQPVENGLYTTHAPLYATLADDRDFAAELTAMRASALKDGNTFVELFAGPAYHSVQLARMNSGVTIVAVDTSPEMEAVARRRGFSGRYMVKDAIAALERLDQLDLVCIPRFSVGLVDDDYLVRLLALVRRKLSSAGIILMELHGDGFVDHVLSSAQWKNLNIQERVAEVDNATIRCIWPHEIRMLSLPDTYVEMDVLISRTTGGFEERFTLQSREYVRSSMRLCMLAAKAGLAEVPERHFQASSGHYMAFRRDDGTDEDRRARLRQGAFGAIFPLSSSLDRERLLARSGLDLEKHDAPLSLHVYNLL